LSITISHVRENLAALAKQRRDE